MFDCCISRFQTLPASGKNFQTEENNYGNNKANIFNAESCMPLSKLDENMKNKIRKNAIAPITQAVGCCVYHTMLYPCCTVYTKHRKLVFVLV